MASEESNGAHFGASVLPTPTTPTTPRIHVIHEKPSTDTLANASTGCRTPMEEYDPTSSHPCSPFYSPAATRCSIDYLKPSSAVALNVSTADLEAGHIDRLRQSIEDPNAIHITPSKECSQWPGQAALGRKKKELKRERVCTPLRNLNRTQRLWAKIIIAMVIVGAATGIGIGVSKATGAGIWKNQNQSSSIGGSGG